MNTLGLIGGVSPESTIEYYRTIIAAYREHRDSGYPSIIINSIDLDRMRAWFDAGDLSSATSYLVAALESLAEGGADFGAISAVTPHILFEEVRRRSPLRLISIVEATRDAAIALRINKLGLFGTRFTMQARLFPDVFEPVGIQILVPNDSEQTYIHDKYFVELVKGVFLDETRQGLITIIERMKADEGIEAIILGGTELSLILRDDDVSGIPLLDATKIHVAAIVKELIG